MKFTEPICIFCVMLCGMISCYKKPGYKQAIKYSDLKAICTVDQGIIVSCNQCHCILDFMEKYCPEPGSVIIYDSNCINLRRLPNLQYVQLNSSKLDTLYDRNYNALLFKGLNDSVTFRTYQLSSSTYQELEKSAHDFFDEH